MQNRPIHPISRRAAVQALGAAAIGLPAIANSPLLAQSACTVLASPSLTEGPYFVDEDMNRTDIRLDPADGSIQAGMPLSLSVNISQLVNCSRVPLTGAYVDVWHCNASGVYSDVAAQNSVGRKFLCGWQATNRQGNVYFLTVYPGWYQGRAVHIHAKIRIFSGYDKSYEFTSQFFFDDTFTDQIYALNPYSSHPNRDTRNTQDGIYTGPSSTGTAITANSGNNLMFTLRKADSWVEAQANLVCDLSLGSSPSQTPGAPGGPGGPGGPPPLG